MMNHGSPRPFIWYDIVTDDVDAAMAFYGAVAGWTFTDMQEADRYHKILADGQGIGGCVHFMPDATARGAKPAWIGYIHVPDIDAAIAALVADGASVMMPRMNVPQAGAIALLADPWGARFHIIMPSGAGESRAFTPRPDPGHFGWNELACPEPEAARTFYGKHFGWLWPEPMDMGPAGKYHFFDMGHGGASGAITRLPDGQPRAMWLHYIWADEIDAAIARVLRAGGTVLHGPHEVPGGLFVFHASDPRGAAFAMAGPRSGQDTAA